MKLKTEKVTLTLPDGRKHRVEQPKLGNRIIVNDKKPNGEIVLHIYKRQSKALPIYHYDHSEESGTTVERIKEMIGNATKTPTP